MRTPQNLYIRNISMIGIVLMIGIAGLLIDTFLDKRLESLSKRAYQKSFDQAYFKKHPIEIKGS